MYQILHTNYVTQPIATGLMKHVEKLFGYIVEASRKYVKSIPQKIVQWSHTIHRHIHTYTHSQESFFLLRWWYYSSEVPRDHSTRTQRHHIPVSEGWKTVSNFYKINDLLLHLAESALTLYDDICSYYNVHCDSKPTTVLVIAKMKKIRIDMKTFLRLL